MEPIIKIEPMLSQPTGIVLLISTVTIATLSTIQMSLLFLFISFIFDFLTGIYASWVEWKNKKIQITTYLIESKTPFLIFTLQPWLDLSAFYWCY